jgi:hypothetical protein
LRCKGDRTIVISYDDGGYSGGSTDRPALQRLLADIRDRRIDVVVVYKVDRLTTRTGLYRDSNLSLLAPRIPARKGFGEARDWPAVFGDMSLFRATEIGFPPSHLAKAAGS